MSLDIKIDAKSRLVYMENEYNDANGTMHSNKGVTSLVPQGSPSFSMLYAEMPESLVCEITCGTS